MSDSTVELKAILKDEISNSLLKIEINLRQLGSTGESVGRQMSGATMPVIKSVQDLTDELQRNVAQLGKQRDAMKTPEYQAFTAQQAALKKEIGELGATGQKTTMSMTDMVAGFYMARQAAGVLASGIMAIVDAAKQYDSVRARLTATEGSPLVAADDLKRLQELAKLPGLGFGEASQAMASLRSLHVSAKDTFALIDGIAKGNASMGGGAEAFGRVMYQINQSISKSKIDMTDLKPVLEAIPNIGSMIAEKFGSIDSDAINAKLASMGKTSKDFWMDIAEMAAKLPPAGETIANNIDNMGDAWKRLKASLGDPSQIKALTGALAELLDKLAQSREKGLAEQGLRLRAEANLGIAKGSAPGRLLNMVFSGDEINKEMERLRQLDAFNLSMDKAKKEREDKAAADKLAATKKQADADKKAAESVESLRKQIHDNEAKATQYVKKTGANEVTLIDGAWGDDPTVAEHNRNRAKAEAKADQKADKEVKEKERLRKEEERTTEARVKLADRVAEAQRKSAEEQIKAQREIAQQGEKTFATLAMVAENAAGKQTATYKTLFAVSKGFAIADASIQIADALAKSANEPFPLNVAAMATTAALTAGIVADIQSVTMRARGGPMFGGGIVGERGQERITPIVPSVITPSHKTVNQYGGNSITIIVKGGVDNRTLRNIREAVTDRRQSSR